MSKSKFHIIIPIFLLLFLLSSCTNDSKINNSSNSISSSSQSQSSSSSDTSSIVTSVVAEPVTGGFNQGEAKSYTNSRLKFSFDYLKNWELKDKSNQTSSLPASFDINKDMVTSALTPFIFNETSTSPDFTNTFYLTISSNDTQVQTDYYAIHKDEIWKRMQDQYNSTGIMSIVNEDSAKLKKYGYIKAVVLEYSTKAAFDMIRCIEGTMVKGKNTYIFTYSYATKDADPKAKRAIFDNIMLSLKLND
jgi:hypothetical protein